MTNKNLEHFESYEKASHKTFIEQKKQDSLKGILLCMLPVLYVNFY